MQKKIRTKLIQLLGRDNYLDSETDRLAYAYDSTARVSSTPDAVLFPGTTAQVSEILKLANQYGVPIVPRGAGSGLTGGALATRGGLMLVMTRFNRIVEIDADNLLAVVEPGVVTSQLNLAVQPYGLFYPPDPGSTDFCTIGGNIAENAGGMRAVKYGVTKDYVLGLEVVLPSGEIIHTGSKCIKDVVGYDLTRLFVGSEGTLGVVTRAILKLRPMPEGKKTLTASFKTLGTAAKTVPDIFRKRIIPTTLEFIDKHCLRAVEDYIHIGLPVQAEAMLLIEVDGKLGEIDEDIERVRRVCVANEAIEIKVAQNPAQQDDLWKARRSIHAALEKSDLEWEEEDIAVPVARVPVMVAKLEEIGQKYDLLVVCFGHYGDGNLHVSLASEKAGADSEEIKQAKDEILKATISLEGRIAAEHGIGMLKQDKVRWNIDPPTFNLMRSIKELLDPNHIMNPGKVFPPDRK